MVAIDDRWKHLAAEHSRRVEVAHDEFGPGLGKYKVSHVASTQSAMFELLRTLAITTLLRSACVGHAGPGLTRLPKPMIDRYGVQMDSKRTLKTVSSV